MRVKKITAAFAAFVLTFSSVAYDFPAGCMHTSHDIASAEYSYDCITAELQGSGECSWAPELQWSGYNLEGYNTYRVHPGDIIEVSVKIADPSGMGLNAISLRNEFGNLEFVRAEPDYESYLYSETKNIIHLLKSYAEAAMLNEKNLITYTFRVPLDAAPREVFKVDWTDESDYEFVLMNTERSRKNLLHKLIPAAFVAESFAGEVTTTPVTTNVTKPVTTTVTTPAETKPASTSAAPVTTSVSVPAAEIRGDVDGNGSVNTIDLISLTECIVSPENFSNKARYDVNSDGSVNAQDLLLLKKTFAAFMKEFAPSGPASSSTEPPVTTAPQYTAPPETTLPVTTEPVKTTTQETTTTMVPVTTSVTTTTTAAVTTTPQVTTTAVTTTENIQYMDAYNKIIEKH